MILLTLLKIRSFGITNRVAGLNLRIYNEDHDREWLDPYWYIRITRVILLPVVFCCSSAKKAISGLGHMVSRHVHRNSHDRQRHDDTELGVANIQGGAELPLFEPTPETRTKDVKDQYCKSLRNTLGDDILVDIVMFEIDKWDRNLLL